ncbi:hypothetical protein FPV67DRAFT_1683453 [Lyophyllum atratum]|nr:hypothetical protein FPV67DRAFT_1683453 [Lyophyllum atratum]
MTSVRKAMDAVHSVGNDLRQTLLAVKASDTAETRLELKKLFDACKAAALPFNRQTSTIMARFKESFLGRVLASYHKYVLNRDAEVALQEMFRVLEVEDAVRAMEGAAPSPSIPGASPASVEPADPVPPGSALDVHSPGPPRPIPADSITPPLPSIRVSQQPPQSPPAGDFEDVVRPPPAKAKGKGKGKQRQAKVASPPSKKVTKKKRRPEETDDESEGDAIAARASKPQKRLKATNKRNKLPCVNCDVAGIPCIKTESGSACFSCASSKRGCTVATLSRKRKRTGGAPGGRDTTEDESERDSGDDTDQQRPVKAVGKSRERFGFDLNGELGPQVQDLLTSIQAQLITVREEVLHVGENVQRCFALVTTIAPPPPATTYLYSSFPVPHREAPTAPRSGAPSTASGRGNRLRFRLHRGEPRRNEPARRRSLWRRPPCESFV